MKCRDAARLMSQGLDRDLAGGERFTLRLHLLICAGCRNFRRQLAFLRAACRQRAAADDDDGDDKID